MQMAGTTIPGMKNAKTTTKAPLKRTMRDKKGLTGAQEAYASLLAQGQLSQAEAFRQAFPRAARWKDATVWREASKLALSNEVSTRVSELLRQAADANEVTQADALRGYLNILRADPRKLVGYHRDNCRYCHGIGHRYQFTASEMADAEANHALALLDNPKLGEFDTKGGIGFDRTARPNPECPECRGEGVGRVVIGDTRDFGEKERALYIGVKIGKDGIEVKMHDRMEALTQLARHVGFFELDNEVKVSGEIVPAELEAIYSQRMASAAQKSAEAKARPARMFGDEASPGDEPNGGEGG